ARHDVGSHINMGSIHPTVTERLEHANWADGCARMAADELVGIDEMGDILGKKLSSLARHGGSFGAQLLMALGSRKIPYVYSPASLPRHNITWYCNTLNFFEAMSVFQEAYLSRDALLAAEGKFLDMVEKQSDSDWIAMFHSHPCRIRADEFPCKNYYHGKNNPREDWESLALKSDYSLDEVRSNWALHCQRVRENPDLDLKTIAELSTIFGNQAKCAGKAEIAHLAEQAAEMKTPFHTDRFSAAEIVDILARAYLHLCDAGELPVDVERRNVFGPTAIPLSVPTAKRLNAEALSRIARGVVAAVELTGCLPSVIRCGEGTLGSLGQVGIGSAMAALGRAISSGDSTTVVEPSIVAPYPPEGDEIPNKIRKYRLWRPHRGDLDIADVSRLAVLQSWTLKPAWENTPPDFISDIS
ncbi:MAG: hypothetical protein KAG97_09690, partial [Victivallales bacterium]|nr:hypothetical protein [Victivallales bacterium]